MILPYPSEPNVITRVLLKAIERLESPSEKEM